jgi:chitinase
MVLKQKVLNIACFLLCCGAYLEGDPMQQSNRPGFRHCLVGLALMMIWQPFSGYSADFFLKWNPNSEPDLLGYYIYYQEGVSTVANPAGATRVTIALDDPGFDAANPGYSLTGLKDGTPYYFAVSAYNAAGESELSAEVFLTKGPGDDPTPAGSTDSSSGSGGSGGCFIGAAQ